MLVYYEDTHDFMTQIRHGTHTTLTETAQVVVTALKQQSGVKLIAPGIIDARRSGKRHITVVYTTAGFELIISGQGVQKVAVHLSNISGSVTLIRTLKSAKNLKQFAWNERVNKPGQ
jgi:hypothetical protein